MVDDPVLSTQLHRTGQGRAPAGDPTSGLASAEQAIALAEEVGLPYELGRALELRAECLDDLGMGRRPQRSVSGAPALLTELGVVPRASPAGSAGAGSVSGATLTSTTPDPPSC